jgi:hypothetical protein
MKRSFRVATVFTGAAAVAALAPTAAAQAAPIALGAALTGGYAGNCPDPSGGIADTVLYYASSENHYSPAACFSGTGIKHSFAAKRFSWYCAGQNYGYMWVGGQKLPFTFGDHNLYKQYVSAVEITGVYADLSGLKCAERG